MDIDNLKTRLRKAHNQGNSLRDIGRFCDVSHETVRKLILSPTWKNIHYPIYEKLDNGLKEHGF